MNLNKALLTGNLVKDPEVRTVKDDRRVAKMTLAVDNKYGQKEELLFMEVVYWGKVVDTIESYCTKGKRVLVEGRIKTDSYNDEEGNTKYRTYINGENLVLL